jgi:hypothetical protein
VSVGGRCPAIIISSEEGTEEHSIGVDAGTGPDLKIALGKNLLVIEAEAWARDE